MKNDTREQITEGLKSVTSAKPYLCDHAESVYRTGRRTEGTPDRLTPSEREILHEIAAGKTTKEIAFEKNLSFHTVNSHRRNIFRKIEVNNVHEAIRYAIRAGIFDIAEYQI